MARVTSRWPGSLTSGMPASLTSAMEAPFSMARTSSGARVKPLISYHEHNEMTRAPELVLAMENGASIALVSDAGMPLVSDPGHRLVTLAIRHRIPVVPIPGPAALFAALSASGLPSEEFLFVGFLPARSGERRRALEHLRIEERTMIFYEAPHRIADTVADALAILGNRPACLAREVTKL